MEFILVAEGPSDVDISKDLVDRVLHAEPPDWLRMSELEGMRTWSGVKPGTEYTQWRDIGELYAGASRVPRYLGHSREDQANDYDYAAARRVLMLIERKANNSNRRIRAVVLVRDSDTQLEERVRSLQRARQDHSTDHFEVALGIARPKSEAWILNGFVPQSEAERERLQEEQRKLPVNPLTEAHELTATSGNQNSCKRVVRILTGDDETRKSSCWKDTDLDLLRERGQQTGLSDFLEDIERLIPLFR